MNSELSQLLIESIDLLDEGAVKTSKKHKLDKYLAGYNYEGDKKKGTIIVDGKKYKVDRDTKSPTICSGNENSLRQLTYRERDNTIYLDNNFENLKNNKRRDALLQHEIGHNKLHSLNDKNNIEEGKDAVYDSIAKKINKFGDPQISKENLKIAFKNFGLATDGRKATTEKDKKRVKNLEIMKKHEGNNVHEDRIEFEADAYASVHKNGDHLKRALRDNYKKMKSDKHIKKILKYTDTDMDKEMIKKGQNKAADNDMKYRSKSLKDKSINRSIYRESIELVGLLNDSINLLNN